MSWAGKFIKIDAVKSSSEKEDGGIILNWEVVDIDAPDGPKEQDGELLVLITEAFKVMGRETHRSDGIAKVNVNIKAMN